jgi:hypothetical protein
MSAFVCARCRSRIDEPHKRFERRIEFRSAHNQSRYKVLLDIHICRACVDEEVSAARPTPNQGAML